MVEWIPASEAAPLLNVEPRQVRRLAAAGVLPARRSSAGWLVDAEAVRRRAGRQHEPGRPLSSFAAWQLLCILAVLDAQAARNDDHELAAARALLQPLAPMQRSRLRARLADLAPAGELARALRGRAQRHRVAAHPGLVRRILADPRVRPGGAAAAAEQGMGIAAGSAAPLAYLSAHDEPGLRAEFMLNDDPAGNLDLAVIPGDVAQKLSDWGRPMPPIVAAIDLLDDPDARSRDVAQAWIHRLRGKLASVSTDL